MKISTENLIVTLIVTYFFLGLVTFGHAYNQDEASYIPKSVFHPTPGEHATVIASVSSVFWPLYWSKEYFKKSQLCAKP
jgi:hypothetical protein